MDKTKYWLLIIMLVLVAAAFFPALFNGFVNWDDDVSVYRNPAIREVNIQNLRTIFSSIYIGNYLPVTMLSYALDYHFSGYQPFFYHLTNLKLHLYNCLLVFWLFYLLAGDFWPAFFAVLFFAVHPLRVESVAWVAERKDVLESFFFLSSLVAYACRLKSAGPPRKLMYFCWGLFLLALLAKPVALVLPLVMILMDYFFRGKFIDRLTEKIPFFALAIFWLFLGLYAQNSRIFGRLPGSGLSLSGFSWAGAFILGKIFWPFNLSVLYFAPDYPVRITFLGRVFSVVLSSGLLLLAAAAVRKYRPVMFGILFFYILLLPIIGLFLVDQWAVIQDRYAYLASAGVFFVLAWLFTAGYSKYLIKVKILKYASWLLTVFLIAGLCFLTFSGCRIWKNSVTLWSRVLEFLPRCSLAYTNRALGRMDLGDYPGARADFNRILLMKPDFSLGYANRGWFFIKVADYPAAILDTDRALKLNPRLAYAYAVRGRARELLGRRDQAESDYRQASRLEPGKLLNYSDLSRKFSVRTRPDSLAPR